MALLLLSRLLFEMRCERVQPSLPGHASGEDPLLQGAKAPRFEPTPTNAATLLPRDQAGRRQDLKVLVDPRERHGERRRHLGDAGMPARESFDDGPAGGIGEGSKRVVEGAALTVKQ